MEGKRKGSVDDGGAYGSSPKRVAKSRCAHDTRVAAYQVAALQDAFKLPGGGIGSSGGGAAAVNVERADAPGGLLVVRNFCSRDEADAIYYTLDSDEAAERSWTGLKHGGNSVKCYTGTPAGMGLFNNKYKKVWGRARRTAFLEGAALTDARERVTRLVRNDAAGLPPQLELLTEQLIKYAKDDAFFNLHWDIDAETPGAPLPSGNPSELGPGCVIAALNLQSDATVMLQPRYASVVAPSASLPHQRRQPPSAPAAGAAVSLPTLPAVVVPTALTATDVDADADGFTQPPTPAAAPTPAPNPTRKVKVELKHGDLYLISGAARWEWLHGVSLHPDAALEERRAVVWRFQSAV